jgi:hypothetical protein
MRYILLILFSISILIACVSPSKHIYWHPEAPGGTIETYNDIINDWAVPTRGVVFQAPDGVEFRVISHARGFAITINIPEGVVVKFLSDRFRIDDKSSGEIIIHQQKEIKIYKWDEISYFNAGYILYKDMHHYYGFKGIPFMEQLVGETVLCQSGWGWSDSECKKPYLIVFYNRHIESNEYSLEIPPMLINGKTFQIPVINFTKKEGSFLLIIH